MFYVFGFNNCPACNIAKQVLEGHDLPYTYVNVKENEQAMTEIKKRGVNAVPVIIFARNGFYDWDNLEDNQFMVSVSNLHSFIAHNEINKGNPKREAKWENLNNPAEKN